MVDREIVARALTGFVHTVSVWHSAEHHVYGELPVRVVPQRLRVPLPTGNDVPIPTDQWVRPTDVFRQEMARRMFYEAHTVRAILEVDYGFGEPALKAAAGDLAEALRRCDRGVPRRFIALEKAIVACGASQFLKRQSVLMARRFSPPVAASRAPRGGTLRGALRDGFRSDLRSSRPSGWAAGTRCSRQQA